MISVVMPIYNGERYMRESIDSVLCQRENLELIIVDDASTDSTPDIIQEYYEKDRRVRYTRLEKNRKLPGALNEGFKLARGHTWTWTSHDNLYLQFALDTMDREMLQSDVDVIYAGVDDIDEKGDVIRRNPTVHGDISRIYGQNVVHACFLFKPWVFTAVGGYDESLYGGEDWDFWVQAKKKGARFEYIPQVLYQYRIHPGSITATRRAENKKAWARVIWKNRIWWKYHRALGMEITALGMALSQRKPKNLI